MIDKPVLRLAMTDCFLKNSLHNSLLNPNACMLQVNVLRSTEIQTFISHFDITVVLCKNSPKQTETNVLLKLLIFPDIDNKIVSVIIV